MLQEWTDLAPVWAWRTASTLAIVAAAWIAGRLLAMVLTARVQPGATRVTESWLGAVRLTLRSRLPLWAVLIGLWVASGHWPLTPEARLFLSRALFVVGAASLTLAVAQLVTGVIDTYGTRVATVLPVTSLTRNIARATVVVLGGLMILNGVGISITPMLTALGVGGLAVALALQEPLSNFFAGFFLSIAGQLRVGDYVTLDGGHGGYISDFSWRSTRIRMLANNLIVVPNAYLAKAVVVNYHLPSTDLAVLVEVGVDYASDLPHVERVVVDVGREVMKDVPGGVPDFEPFIRFHTFADSSVNFTTILRADEYVGQYLVKHEFVKRLHARFAAEGIVIPFPIRTVHHVPPAGLPPAGAAAPTAG